MLVLSRKVREAVLIGDDLVITVTRVKGRTVRLAIDAPSGVSIARLDLPRAAHDADDAGDDAPDQPPSPTPGKPAAKRRSRVVEV